MRRILWCIIVFGLLGASAAEAANSVVIESKTVEPGATDITVAVKLTNDISIRSVVLPFVIRELTPGCFPTNLTLAYGDRLPNVQDAPLSDVVIANQYPTPDGACLAGQPGGFGTNGPLDYVSPDGVLFARARVFSPSLAPGTDATGSVILTLTVSSVEGTFEIDTTCMNIANHLTFNYGEGGSAGFAPQFSKGTITVASVPANSFVVESKTVTPGATGVDIPIRLNNAVELRSLVVPLVIREITPGAYITGLTMTYGDRLPETPGAPLTDVVVANQYPTPDGTCKSDQPGGFGTNGTVDFVSPDAVMFTRARISGSSLPPGEDADGSMHLTVDVTSVEGTFEIDTTCTNIANHLTIADNTLKSAPLLPSFTKGIITIQAPPNELPVAVCQVDPEVSIGAGCAGASVIASSMDGGSYDPDGTIQSYRLNPEGPFSLGTHFAWLVVEDNDGGLDSCGLVLSVVDDIPPVLACPNDTTVTFTDNSCGAIVDFTANAADDCGGASVVTMPVSGTFFPAGIATVECVATDDAGNADTCWFDITVTDGADPWLVCNLDDDGPGSLRDAIETANANAGADMIEFAVSGVVEPLSPLPALSDVSGGTTIDGFTAPGASESPHVVTVTLDGTFAGSGSGITLSSDANVVRGLEIRNFPDNGVTVTGSARQNTISANLIHSNGALGIDLGDDGVTVNDPGDGDGGANDLINYPTLDTVFLLGQDSFYVAGLASTPGSIVEMYLAEKYLGVDTVGDPSGYGEGWRYFGSRVSDPTTGYYLFSPVVAAEWSSLTMTETDPQGNTSEFSPNRLIIPDSLIVTAYSPVTLVVISPDGQDSIGIDFNTMQNAANYDFQTDWGIGPSGTEGEPDDRIVVTNLQPGEYTIKIRNDGTAGEGDNYFLGIRVDGSAEDYASVSGQSTSPEPVANVVPPPNVIEEFTLEPASSTRGDLDGDNFITALDLNIEIDILFFNAPAPNPPALADINCDGFPDANDLNYMIDYLFFNGPVPCF